MRGRGGDVEDEEEEEERGVDEATDELVVGGGERNPFCNEAGKILA